MPSWMCPGHQAMAGSLMPPSNVVSFPQRNGPLLPPEEARAVKTALNPGIKRQTTGGGGAAYSRWGPTSKQLRCLT